ncbi:MAG: cation diffusion facilitator family transporter [Sciscionella sp.]
MSEHGGRRAVLAALSANAGIAVAKFVGFAVTGSSSMLAEAVHSVADTANQGLLLFGRKAAQRQPDARHPFGFGRERYFAAFIVALLLFSVGAIFAVYEGAEKILHPAEVSAPLVAVVILVVALGLEGYSFHTAVGEAVAAKKDAGWWTYIREATAPELPVVLLEDSAALIGLVLALLGVGVSTLTGNPVFDGLATVLIGVLLAVVAIVLIVEMKSLLIGEGANAGLLAEIVAELESGTVARVIHIRTQYLAPDELLVAAKIAMHGRPGIGEVAAAIDDAELRVRAKVPEAALIYLEPDLDRAAEAQAPEGSG